MSNSVRSECLAFETEFFFISSSFSDIHEDIFCCFLALCYAFILSI